MDVKKPVFIVGVGRSGSTVFHKIFARHPQVSWLSNLCDKYPHTPSINRFLMRAIDYPFIGQYLQKRTYPEESYVFWDAHCKGFRVPCRDLVAADVTLKMKETVRNVMAAMLAKERTRLLVKVTGWPRVGFLHEIFEDAKFIHIVRDGRAVANSFINMDWWWGWRGPSNWRWGELTPAQNEEWEKHGRSFLVLACIEWKILMDAMEQAKTAVPKENFLEIKYEDLCSEPAGVFKNVIEFCELQHSKKFDMLVKQYPLKNINSKWKRELTADQQRLIANVLDGHLKKYQYI